MVIDVALFIVGARGVSRLFTTIAGIIQIPLNRENLITTEWNKWV